MRDVAVLPMFQNISSDGTLENMTIDTGLGRFSIDEGGSYIAMNGAVRIAKAWIAPSRGGVRPLKSPLSTAALCQATVSASATGGMFSFAASCSIVSARWIVAPACSSSGLAGMRCAWPGPSQMAASKMTETPPPRCPKCLP